MLLRREQHGDRCFPFQSGEHVQGVHDRVAVAQHLVRGQLPDVDLLPEDGGSWGRRQDEIQGHRWRTLVHGEERFG